MTHVTEHNAIGLKGRTARLALSGVLALSMGAGAMTLPSVSAYAADGSVTIQPATPTAANTNATYDAYAFFNATIDDQNKASGVTWALTNTDRDALITFLGANYTTWLTDNNHTDAAATTNPANALEFISSSVSASAGINSPRWVDGGSFASSLAKWATTNLTATGTATADTAYTAPEGYYLFVTKADSLSTGEMGTAPIWFPLGGAATTITEKAALPNIKKEVQEDKTDAWGHIADAEVGQDVNYRITLTMPSNLNTFETFYGQLNDTLPAGMTLDTADVQIMVGTTDITDKFTVAFANQKLTATCNNLKAITGVVAGSDIVVTYKAHFTLTPAPVYGGAGNINTATFDYSNDPNTDTHGTTKTVDAKAYTYKIKIDKLNADKTTHLSGAQFTIKNADGNYLTAAGTWSTAKTDAASFTTDTGGVATIAGLDEGDYIINEVVAPTGYKLYTGDIKVTITATFDTAETLTLGATLTGGLSGTAVDAAGIDASAGTIEIDVTDELTPELAMSGAQGVGLGGVLVVAVGAVWYIARRRKNQKAEEK